MATTNDLKNGMVLNIDGQLWAIVEFQHVKPGKGPAFVRTKLRNVESGKNVDKTFNAGTKVETATVDKRHMQYLYRDGDSFYFMDTSSYEQVHISGEALGDSGKATAHGVHRAMRAAVRQRCGAPSLSGCHVVIQGCGSVGASLARELAAGCAVLLKNDDILPLGADVKRYVGGTFLERLEVGVDGNEFHALDAFVNHTIDGIGSAASHTDHLNDG